MDNYDNPDGPRDMRARITAFRNNLRVMLGRQINAEVKTKASVGRMVTRSNGRIELLPPETWFQEKRRTAWTRLKQRFGRR
jgi:hypothetical protein